jgi:hypothetical protein
VLEYLMLGRRPAPGTHLPYPDHGQALGEVVVAADQDRTDRVGTEIASRFLNTYMQGLTSTKDTLDGQNAYGHRLSALRPAVADVLAYHINDLQSAIRGEVRRSTSADEAGGQHVALEHGDRLATLFADLTADRPGDLADVDSPNPNAIQVIIRAQILCAGERLQEAARLSSERLVVESGRSSDAMSYLLTAAQIGLSGISADEDAGAKFVRTLLAQGAALMPVNRIPGIGQVGGVAYENAADHLLGQALPADSGVRQGREDLDVDEVMGRLGRDQIEVAVSQAGRWPAGRSPADWFVKPSNQHPESHCF